jgi:hypothetical protein
LQKIRIHTGARIDTYSLVSRASRISRTFERLPRTFEEDPVLRIHNLRIARGHSEKVGVEIRGTIERSAPTHEIRFRPDVWSYARTIEVCVGWNIETFDAIGNIAPKSIEVGSSGKAAREPNNRDRVTGHLISH